MINTILTPTQKKYLDFICKYRDIYGDVPSILYISKMLGKSVSTVHESLTRLNEKGYIRKGYYERYEVLKDGETRTVEAFKQYLTGRISDPEIIKIILEY